MAERLRFGILGAADIARKALIPAIEAAANAELVALASRDAERGRRLFAGRGHARYPPAARASKAGALREATRAQRGRGGGDGRCRPVQRPSPDGGLHVPLPPPD